MKSSASEPGLTRQSGLILMHFVDTLKEIIKN